MQAISQSFSLLWNALFLEDQAYSTMSENKSPVRKGLVILIILGLALALAGFIGTTLKWASSPSLDAIRDTVYEINQQAPWWHFLEEDPGSMQRFKQIWDQIWQFVGYLVPTPTSSLTGFIVRPLGLIISWLIFGVLVHLFARLLGGTAVLGQTLGATSLAAAPQLLSLLTALPFVVVAGIGTWTLFCRYMAVRVTHELSWARALWSVLLTLIVLWLLLMILVVGVSFIAGSIIAATFAGGQ